MSGLKYEMNGILSYDVDFRGNYVHLCDVHN